MTSKPEPEINELGQFLDEFNKETDRGAALTATAYLDERLNDILTSFFVDAKEVQELLYGFNAPLGTFSAKITSAYALGLIQPNEYEELNIIRKVRNEFGHSWQGVSFKSGKVSDLCALLPWLGPEELEAQSGARERFNFAVAILLIDLLWRARIVKKEKRKIKNWPNKTRK
jgi:hypothetical protein